MKDGSKKKQVMNGTAVGGSHFETALVQRDVCEIDLIPDERPQRKTKACEGLKQLGKLEGAKLRH
jgi:hypothetical protein